MARAQIYSGVMVHGERPNWQPLLNAVGEEACGDFMWMFEVLLSERGAAFVYESPDRYRAVPLTELVAAVVRKRTRYTQ
jgi:hypothetical protein